MLSTEYFFIPSHLCKRPRYYKLGSYKTVCFLRQVAECLTKLLENVSQEHFPFSLLPFIHLGGERHCERKLPRARRHDNVLVFRRALSGVQPTNHEAVTVLCARQLLLHRIRMRYHITCRKLIKCNSKNM